MSLESLVKKLAKHRVYLALFIVLSVFGAATLVMKLDIRSSFEDLLPQEFNSVQVLKKIPERVGGPGYLVLGIIGRDLVAMQQFADALVPQLEELSLVRFVTAKRDNFLSRHRLLFADYGDLLSVQEAVQEEVAFHRRSLHPLFFSLQTDARSTALTSSMQQFKRSHADTDGYYATPDDKVLANDERMLAVLVKPRGFPSDIPFSQKLLLQVEQAIAKVNPQKYHASLFVRPLGAYSFNEMEYRTLKIDFVSSFLLALFGIICLLTVYFRSARILVWISLPPLVGLVWTFGLTYLFIGYLNTQTVFMAAILLGIVVDASIHLCNHYFLARERIGNDPTGERQANFKATVEAMRTSIRPISAAVVTTGGAFLVLTATDFLAFKHFGVIGSLGLLLCMVSTYALFCLLTFMLPIQKVNFLRNPWIRLVDRLSTESFPLRAATGIILLVLLLAGLSMTKIRDIQFEYDVDNLKTENIENDRYMAMLQDIFPKGLTPTVVLPNSIEEVRAVAASLKERQRLGAITTVDRVETLDLLVPERQEEKLAVMREIKAQLQKHRKLMVEAHGEEQVNQWQNWLDVSKVEASDLPATLLERFRGVDGSVGLFVNIYPNIKLNDGLNLRKHAAEIGEIRTSLGTFYAGGESVIFADMLSLMHRDGKKALLLALSVIFIALFILYRKVSAVFIVLAPLTFGTILLCGAMAYFGIKLNFFNFVIFPSVLGIGVDNGIHIYNRFRFYPHESVSEILRKTGGAVTVTSLTTIIGFSALLLSTNQALYSVGLLALIGVGLCWICSITLMPALLYHIRTKQMSGKSMYGIQKEAVGN